MRKLFLILSLCPAIAFAISYPTNDDVKKSSPSRPEANGLRLEVNATLSDNITTDGITWKWGGAFLAIEVAVHNISQNPITVPTRAFDKGPEIAQWPDWTPGMERIRLFIESPSFKGKPTVYAESVFAPVVLRPGEYALLFRHRDRIDDRKRADSIKEAAVFFGVASAFVGPKDWWRGNLLTYGKIQRLSDPEKEIADRLAYKKQHDAERADKDFLKKLPAKIATLIVSADRVAIRSEDERNATETMPADTTWIRRFSEKVGRISISEENNCLCSGWLTAYFYKGEERVVSVAAAHDHQLRIYWKNGGGDFTISEEQWNAIHSDLKSAKLVEPKADLNH